MVYPVVYLQIISFLDFMSMGLILPHLANHAKEIGFSYVQIGIMGALYSACQTISAPLVGSLSDIRGTRPIFLLCLAVCSISYFWLGITSSVAVFFLLRAVLGTFKQIQLLVKAVVAEYTSETSEQGVVYGKLIAIAGFGMSAGPIIGGNVLEWYPNNGFTILTTIVGTMFALNIGLISLVPFKSKDKKQQSKEAAKLSLLQSMGNTLKESVNEFYKVDWTVFWDIFLYKMIAALTMGLYFSNFGLFLKTEHDVSPKHIGYIVAFQGIVGAVSNFLISYINSFYSHDKDYTQRSLHIMIGLTLSLIGLASVPELYMYILILIPKSICGSVGRVVSMEMTTSRGNPDQKGAIMGVSNSVKSLTGVITPIIGGVIAQYVGIKYAFYVAAVVNTIGVVVCYMTRLKSKKEKLKKK